MVAEAAVAVEGGGLVDNKPSPGTEPIRGEIFSAEHLEAYAAGLAAGHGNARAHRRGFPLLSRVKENGAALHEAHRAIARTAVSERSITPAAEWLADNFHVVDEQLREIRNHLPRDYYLDLPKLSEGDFRDYPRVYAVICAYIAHTDSRLDADILGRFVRSYQQVQPLTIGELWAVAITLRVALIENLRRLADQVVGGREARIRADHVADLILSLRTPDPVSVETGPRDWERFANSPYFDAFAVQLFQRIQDQTLPHSPALEWLDDELARRGMSSQEIIRLEHQKQAALNVSVRNIITSMRLVLELDWKEFFETASQVEAILRASPVYKDMDFASRDLYRHAVEGLARGSGLAEIEIADRAAKAVGNRAPGSTGEIGYLLLGAGRKAFRAEIGYRSSLRETLGGVLKRHGLWMYPGALAAVTVLFAAQGAETLAHHGLGPAAALALAVLGAIPLSEGALVLINRVVAALVPPRILPKLDFSKGIPGACRTLVAVPVMLTNQDEILELLQRLEVHYLANPDGDIRFALLSDWSDASAASMPGDADLLRTAMEGVAELNQRFGPVPGGGPRFLLLHRERRWNPREGKWLGWERKRGKIHELNKLLRGNRDVSFLLTDAEAAAIPTHVRYVITLDADTRLPKGAAARLAGCMGHPLNRARFDSTLGRVTEGYGILQPRVVPSLPEERERTLFHWVTSGQCGIDPYAAAISDVYQDLFGEGSYSGKGIYDVDAFEDSLRDRIPENALLSHDLFEGTFARAGLLTDVEVLEDFPSHYEAHAIRQHRWARGDWQLLPWILGRRGKGMPFLGRWKMMENLRRSLVAPCAFLSLALGWLLAGHPPVAWTAMVLVALLLPYLLSASEAVTQPQAGISLRHYLRDTADGLLQAFSHYVLAIVLLAHQAWLLSDAALRTILRLLLRRGRMLEWITAAQAVSRLRKGFFGLYRGMAAAVLLPAVILYVAIVIGRAGNLEWAAPLLVLWVFSPALAMLASSPRRPRLQDRLTEKERLGLRHTALKTWRFFRVFVGPEDNFLPPDNFQEDPKPVLAHRSSPTNMGLCLLSIATARDLGWLGLGETVQRLEAVLGSMVKLERYRGHFFNWYETRDMRVLEPRYVSTVDSGNLAGHLIALKRICHDYMASDMLPTAETEGLIDLINLVKESALALPVNLRVQAFGRAHMLEALEALETLLAPVPADAEEWSARMAAWETRADAVVDVAHSLVLEQKDRV